MRDRISEEEFFVNPRNTSLETGEEWGRPVDSFQGRINAHRVSFAFQIVQELYESRGGRPGLSVLTSLLVSVDVKLY